MTGHGGVGERVGAQHQLGNAGNKSGGSPREVTDVETITRGCCEQCYTKSFEKFVKMGHFLE